MGLLLIFHRNTHTESNTYTKKKVFLSLSISFVFSECFISNWHEQMQRRHYFCCGYSGFLSQSCNPFIIQRKSVKMDFNYIQAE